MCFGEEIIKNKVPKITDSLLVAFFGIYERSVIQRACSNEDIMGGDPGFILESELEFALLSTALKIRREGFGSRRSVF